MGDAFPDLVKATNTDVVLDLSNVRFLGQPGTGEFLEGIDVREKNFLRWVNSVRNDPSQIHGLFSLCQQPLSLSVLPVVAVLPFRTLGTNEKHGLLGDWLAEDISRSLSRTSLLSVISFLSTRALPSDNQDIVSIRESLKPDFCLCGVLRTDNAGLVLDVDFIDVRDGRILWTRRYAGSEAEFVSAEAPGLNSVVNAIGSMIADEAINHVAGRSVKTIDDHYLLVAAVGLMQKSTLREFVKSKTLLEEAASRAPRAAEVYGWLGKWYFLCVSNRWTTDPRRDALKALDQTARALDLDPNNAFALTIDGCLHNNLLKRLDIAASRYSEALRQNPNESLCWLLKGMLHAIVDEPAEGVRHVERARLLSPLDPFSFFYDSLSASAHLAAGEYTRALELADRSLAMNGRHLSTSRAKITALHNLGRSEEAREACEAMLSVQPDFKVDDYLAHHPAADFRLGMLVAKALRASGAT